jgi:hypothetical protein
MRISLGFGFDFCLFESSPQNFGLFEMVQNFKILYLTMAKAEKVNIKDIYLTA